MQEKLAKFTYDDESNSYYFEPVIRKDPPYFKQLQVTAIIDVADDGTLAGVELIPFEHDLPPPTIDLAEIINLKDNS